jgi:RNA-directed DNA polymerase
MMREQTEPNRGGKQWNGGKKNLPCAPSTRPTQWNQINWPHYENEVKRLQARIVKATKEGRWGKVKALQRLLTRSFKGKALAVKRVTENKGKRTAGVDRILWSTPQAKYKAVETLKRRGYKALPWLFVVLSG